MTSLPSRSFRRVALVGFGLMGGSLARALKSLSAPPQIRAMTENPEDLEKGLPVGALDQALGHGPSLFEDLGTGGRDMTRLAGSAPEIWEDLFRSPPPGLGQALRAVQGHLLEVQELLDRGSVKEISSKMHRTRRWLEEGEWS